MSSRTIMFTNVPKTLSQSALFEMFPGVKNAWVASDTSELEDLVEDHKAALEVFGHVEKVITLRGSASARSSRSAKGFKPPPMDEGHTGLSTVMLEIRGAAADSERRLKAIAATEKAREKELTSRSDEFQNELSGFVEGKKLKKTGGAEEVERVRQRRNEQTLKAMFTGNSVASSNGGGGASGPTSPMSP